MSGPTSDSELLYRKVIHILQHGMRTATYKLATMVALVEFSSENLSRVGVTRELRVPIAELAARVTALYWTQARPFDGQILKQSTQTQSRILEAVVALQLVADPERSMVSVDEAKLLAPDMYRRTLDIVGVTLVEQPLARLQRVVGTPQSLTFLFDDSFLNDNLSRAELEAHGNAILLKPGVAQGLATAQTPLLRTSKSMWIDDVVRLNAIPPERRRALAHHMFGPQYGFHDGNSAQQHDPAKEPDLEEQAVRRKGVPNPPAAATFADRLNFAFDNFHPGSSRPYSTAEVAVRLRAGGRTIGAGHLARVRLGLRNDLSAGTRKALARIFDVDPAFFSDDNQISPFTKIDRQMATDSDEQTGLDRSGHPAPPPPGRHRALSGEETAHFVDHAASDFSQGVINVSAFAYQLNELFERYIGPDGQKVSSSQVAASLQEDGLAVSEALISRLRAGSGSAPNLQTLEALAYYFNVDVEYLTAGRYSDDARTIAVEPVTEESNPALDDDQAHPPATRAVGNLHLSPTVLSDVIRGLSDAAGSHLNIGSTRTNDCRVLLQTLQSVGSCLNTTAGQNISISEQLRVRIVSGWAPMISIHDAGYRTFRQLADVQPAGPPTANHDANDHRD